MSFRRHQSFALNNNTYLDNRLTQFTDVPMRTENLIVRKNTDIGGNLSVGGNLSIKGDISANNFYASGNYYLDSYILIPAGTITMSAAINEPTGWFHCDGRVLDAQIYVDLFTAIQYTYTDISGGPTVFQIPDLRGRTAIGSYQASDAMYGLTQRTIGTRAGEETHTLDSTEIPSHTHTGTTDTIGAHTHGITDPGHTHTQTTINDDFNQSGGNPPGFAADGAGSRTWSNINSSTTGISVNSGGSHNHTFTTNSTGGGQAHNNMQPYLVVRYLIKY